MAARIVWGLVGAVLLAVAPGCEDEEIVQGGAGTAKAAAAKGAPRAAGRATKAGGPAGEPEGLPPLPTREFLPTDFDEGDSNRDPFRSFEAMFRAQAERKVVVQREVLANKFSLDQLKIVGIVRGTVPRVMMNDPKGFGWVIKSGDFVGRPEIVRAGGPGGAEVAVNWRLDRIRPNDAVFVREDPTRPDVPATTRVVSLRTEEELNPEIRTGVRGGGEVNAPTAPPPPGVPALPPESQAPAPPPPPTSG